jgi:hypothetical protein
MFFVALAFFTGVGYLLGDARGAICGAVIMFGFALLTEFVDAVLRSRGR